SPELGGRRPGSPGAELTAGFVISVLQTAGLSPNGPDLGWTQAVGVRVVDTHGLALTVNLPPPLPNEDDEGQRTRGAKQGAAAAGNERARPRRKAPPPLR